MSRDPDCEAPPRPEPTPLVAGVDYYFDDTTGLMVMTAHYLERRGYCCRNGCRHCPYGYVPPGPGGGSRVPP